MLIKTITQKWRSHLNGNSEREVKILNLVSVVLKKSKWENVMTIERKDSQKKWNKNSLEKDKRRRIQNNIYYVSCQNDNNIVW